MNLSRAAVATIVACFLAIITLQMALLANANSCTWDEADHTYAAYMQWKGDFGLNSEHPPLVKFLATIPLQDMAITLPPMLDRPYRLQEVKGGKDFLFGNDANRILFRARMAVSVLTLLLALLVFFAAREMFGTAAGILALTLISFDPTLLAHSALVTTDAGQACFLFGAIYAFYRYANSPSLACLAVTGLVTGLALAAKHSAVLIFPMLLVLIAFEILSRRGASAVDTGSQGPASQLARAFLAISAISVLVLWAFYGFRFASREAGLQLNPTFAVQMSHVPSPAMAAVLVACARWHLLPESYLYGFAHVLFQSKAFHSYLLGTIYPHPVWFYFPVAMLIKSSLTFLLLLTITVWAIASGRFRESRKLTYLFVPAAIYMIFAMAGGMNIGVRHVLPIYIFLSVAIAGASCRLIELNRRWLYPVAALLVFQAISVVHAYPAYVSYANEAFGGPGNVHKYLSDSNSDWGQQLKSVKTYLDRRGIKNCWFAYFGEGVADYSYYGIPCKPLITADSLYFDSPHDVPPSIDGPVLISAGVLSGFEFGPGPLNAYEQFKGLRPVDVIDSGVFVYQGHFEVPLASALSHVQKSGLRLTANDLPAALEEAQEAESLAPDSVAVNQALAQALEANGRGADAHAYYAKALKLGKTTEPLFQASAIKALVKKLSIP